MVVAVRIERDPTFWQRIVDHPEVNHIAQGQDIDIAMLVSADPVLPLASEHGGFIFIDVGAFKRVYELHTLYEPEGWGREVHGAAISAFNTLFEMGADQIVTYETDHPQSRPPLSFGFRAIGDLRESPFGPAKTWILTREAWEQSAARRRACH